MDFRIFPLLAWLFLYHLTYHKRIIPYINNGLIIYQLIVSYYFFRVKTIEGSCDVIECDLLCFYIKMGCDLGDGMGGGSGVMYVMTIVSESSKQVKRL